MSKYNVGVIVGRFQVDELHPGHTQLIETALKECDRVIIFVGTCIPRDSGKNALDFRTREQMIAEEYGGTPNGDRLIVLPLPNMQCDVAWSKQLDTRIREVEPVGSVQLFAGRDSFKPYYHGRFKFTEIRTVGDYSGTKIREEILNEVPKGKQYRRGIIRGKLEPFPKVHPTVDAAVIRYDLTLGEEARKATQIILGKKPGELAWRFPGGFADPTDESYEDAALREVGEELGHEDPLHNVNGLVVTNPQIIKSLKIQDWRYRGETNQIITTFVKMEWIKGHPLAGDDLEDADWFTFKDIIAGRVPIMKAHRKLMNVLLGHFGYPLLIDENNQTTNAS